MPLTIGAAWALIVIAVVNLLLLGGMVYLIFMVRNQFKRLQDQAQPILDEARSTLNTVKDVASDVGKRVESISERADHLAADVMQRVESITADVTQRVEHVTAGFTQRIDQLSADLTERAEHVINMSEAVADRVLERVDTTTAVVEEAVGRPMAGLAGVRAGLSKGLEVWREYRKGGDGRRRAAAEREAEARRMIEQAPAVTPPAEPRQG